MRKILLATALAVSLVGFAKADDAMSGEKADAVKQEIIKLETDRLSALLKNGSEAADWISSHDSDDIIEPAPDGISNTSKTQSVAKWRSGELFLISRKESGTFVDVYEDGNVAICGYYADSTLKRNGKPVQVKTAEMDTWAKFPDGAWRRIVHDGFKVNSIPEQ